MEVSVDEVVKIYNEGGFDKCLKLFISFLSNPKENSLKGNQDNIIKEYLYQNNVLICEALVEKKNAEGQWTDTMNRFIKLHAKYRSLSVIPLDLELNTVHNILWWFNINSQLKCKALYYKSVLDIARKSFIKVLKLCGEAVTQQQPSNNETQVVLELVKRASDYLLRMTPASCLQMLGISTLMAHVFLKQSDSECLSECIFLVRRIVEQLELLKLHMEKKTGSGIEDVYFKFGLIQTASSASLKTSVDCLNAFLVTASLVCLVNRDFERGMQCLGKINYIESNIRFMVNFIKANCCFLSQNYNEAKLYLAYSVGGLPICHEAHYRLLLARVLSATGDQQSALAQCEAVLHTCTSPRFASLAMHFAASVSQQLALSTVQLHHLKQLIKVLKSNPNQKGESNEGFEDSCLFILTDQYSITLHDALYLLGRKLYLNGYHLKALDAYSELTEVLRTEDCEHPKHMPCKTQVLHETIMAYVKADNLKGGEQLCRQLMREYVPSPVGQVRGAADSVSPWETAVYSIDDDIVSIILLADILAVADKKKALEELNRCYNALQESYEQTISVGASERALYNWLMSRVLLRKAKLTDSDDAAHYYRRALMHVPGDKEVVFHYKQWSLWHPDHHSFDPGDNVQLFPVDEIQNLALAHILGCSVTEEEWDALCDPESSQNVIDTLFDDDD